MGARRAWVVYCRNVVGGWCSQCGQRWSDRACGPTHAAVAAARRYSPRRRRELAAAARKAT